LAYLRTYQNSWGTGTPVSRTSTPSGGLIYCNYFEFLHAGWIIGARYFRAKEDGSEHQAHIRLEATNELLAIAKFPIVAASGTGAGTWQSTYFRKRVQITAGVKYYVCVSWGSNLEWHTNSALTGVDITTGDVFERRDSSTHWQGQWSSQYDFAGTVTHAAGRRYALDPIFQRAP
jgi:hypothetical protein